MFRVYSFLLGLCLDNPAWGYLYKGDLFAGLLE